MPDRGPWRWQARTPSGAISKRALALTGGCVQPAAKLLGISRTTLWEKMKRYGLAIADEAP